MHFGEGNALVDVVGSVAVFVNVNISRDLSIILVKQICFAKDIFSFCAAKILLNVLRSMLWIGV